MGDLDKAVIAKLKIRENNFEILVDCEKALELRSGKKVDIEDVLATRDIFSDVKKGQHAADLTKYFGTENVYEISRRIIKEGEVQLTAEYRAKLMQEKKKRLIYLIHRNAINPENNLPHPPQRIESALEEAKARIDEYKTAEEQVEGIVDKIRGILPLRYETREVSVKIPANFAGRSFGTIKQYGKVLKDEWQQDGSLVVNIEIPAGIQVELEDKMNEITKGGVEITIVKSK